MAAILQDGELTLTGSVGAFFWEDGFTHSDVVVALASMPRTDDLTVRINSGGGIADHGNAIYATLKSRPGTVNVVVEGIAASAASIIAMAGDEITMAPGAVMMIHEPQVSFLYADSSDLATAVQTQSAYTDGYAAIYSERTGKSIDDCREMMRAETWMSGEAAVAAGFADKRGSGKPATVTAFDYRAYDHAPKRLTALSKQKDWSLPEADNRASAPAPAPTPQNEEISMTETERADALAAENATLKASLDAANVAKETDVTAATTAAVTSAADIVEICATAGVPAMASALIREGLTVDQARARANNAQEVRGAVETARKSFPKIEANLADAFITSGLSMDQVRSKLFEQMTASQSGEINGSHQAPTGNTEASEAEALAKQVVASIRPNRANKRSA
jgi:ATP-dependent Clp protease protease subunit